MPKFLHLADVHLGFTKYDSPERTKDFFYALQDAIQKHALEAAVDFVLIAGDLFEQRQVLPATLNQAQLCLTPLQEAGIPVLAIEGNHDYRPYGTQTSWLRYLSSWGVLKLLEPNEHEGLEPWSDAEMSGGYIDLPCGVRVIGSRWYGAAAPQAIAKLAVEIERLPVGPPFTVMMFHHGLEGQIARYSGALRYQDFLPLKEAGVDYLALGHIHRNYSLENWIFNPGSIEANSVAENQEQNPRGVYLVELSPHGVKAELKQDYEQRNIVRLSLQSDPNQTAAELEQEAIAAIQTAADRGKTENAIVELRIHGSIGFDRSDLDIRTLRSRLQDLSKALIFLLKYDAIGREFQTYIDTEDELPSRLDIERTVFTDFLVANVNYRDTAETLVQGLLDLKTRVLNQQPEDELYGFVETLLAQTQSASLSDGSAVNLDSIEDSSGKQA
ncbi:exonuclease SbcCD subunit D [Altericista sp. CCNU0014]|uniref:metallophosphoesterase family protein n=1 Tax=Altericista sp. CCNU0014 TaxID=3082949 RepID=UPI00384B140A